MLYFLSSSRGVLGPCQPYKMALFFSSKNCLCIYGAFDYSETVTGEAL